MKIIVSSENDASQLKIFQRMIFQRKKNNLKITKVKTNIRTIISGLLTN